MIKMKRIKGQSTAEYAIILAVVVAGLVAMQTYVKRGLQARYHDGTRFLANATVDIGNTSQYEPYYAESQYTTAHNITEGDTVSARGATNHTLTNDSITRESGGSEQTLGTQDTTPD